ncbi:TadE/TadG family type IV pilus assembly protein [Bosea sp. CS1GBMeth4]|uniref:TadE/TadG family type IV pilus assembly protein n=1 Tax=Bosea sp. CS1GBMeth4 TaxID=1892849 RepID=UPI001647FA76|nr:TadE/TadG family type IV pilus assembly protein [Bosea sp. CS1GBMeth4]
MRRLANVFRRGSRRGIVRDQRGVAAVEFALISTAMFAMLSGAVDLTYAITIQRDLNRIAAEIALALASCSDESCLNQAIQSIGPRRPSIAPALPTIEIGMAYFQEKNNAIDGNSMGGTMTFLPPDMNARALALLGDLDHGVAVRVSYTHRPIILGFADDWGFTVKNFSAWVVTLRRHN